MSIHIIVKRLNDYKFHCIKIEKSRYSGTKSFYNKILLIQHQRHYQHHQFFVLILLGWFNNSCLGWCRKFHFYIITICSVQHLDQKLCIESNCKVFTIIPAFHSFVTFKAKVDILCGQFKLAASNAQHNLVSTFITKNNNPAQGSLEIIFVNYKLVRIIRRNYYFIIRETGIDKTAAHLCCSMLYKKMIAVIAY